MRPPPPAMGRRAAVHAAVLAAAALHTPTLQPAQAAGSLPAAALPAAGAGSWLPLTEFSAAGGAAYPEPFVLYLARFMLNFDRQSAAWFASVQTALPAWWDERERRQLLAEQ
eukprot:3563329-Prymnesium_polylepis.1